MFLCEIVHGYVFGVKDTNGDSHNFLSLSRDLESRGHHLFMDRLPLGMTFVFKVMEWPQHLFIDFRTP